MKVVAFTSQETSLILISVRGSVGRRIMWMKNFQVHHQESNPQPSVIQHHIINFYFGRHNTFI